MTFDAARLRVRVTPRGGADRIEGVGPGGELRVRVRAAPADGAANVALRRIVAGVLEIPLGAVALETGVAARTKRLRVEGRSVRQLMALWPGLDAVDASDPRAG